MRATTLSEEKSAATDSHRLERSASDVYLFKGCHMSVETSVTDGKIKIYIVDDHAIVREGLHALLSLEANFEVVGDAADINEAIVKTPALAPDLIITDLSMPGVTGVSGIASLREHNPTAKIAVLTVHNTLEYIRASIDAGADGYIVKDSSRGELLSSLQQVMRDKVHLCARSSQQFVQTTLSRHKSATDENEETVTLREKEILTMVARGQSNKMIARSLCRSIKTIEKHRANLMRKLDLHNVADVTRYAMRNGLMTDNLHQNS
jgi:DNA-binding NarL/FixJ family response regulator